LTLARPIKEGDAQHRNKSNGDCIKVMAGRPTPPVVFSALWKWAYFFVNNGGVNGQSWGKTHSVCSACFVAYVLIQTKSKFLAGKDPLDTEL